MRKRSLADASVLRAVGLPVSVLVGVVVLLSWPGPAAAQVQDVTDARELKGPETSGDSGNSGDSATGRRTVRRSTQPPVSRDFKTSRPAFLLSPDLSFRDLTFTWLWTTIIHGLVTTGTVLGASLITIAILGNGRSSLGPAAVVAGGLSVVAPLASLGLLDAIYAQRGAAFDFGVTWALASVARVIATLVLFPMMGSRPESALYVGLLALTLPALDLWLASVFAIPLDANRS